MNARALTLFALLYSGLSTAQPVTEAEVRRDIDRLVFDTLSTSKDFASWRAGLRNFESLQKSRPADVAALDKYREEVVRPLLSRENELYQSYNAHHDALIKAGSLKQADADALSAELAVIQSVKKQRVEVMREFAKRNAAFDKKYSTASSPLVKAQSYFSEAMKKRPSQESPRPGYKAVFTKVWADVFSGADTYSALIRKNLLEDPAPVVTRAPSIAPEDTTRDDEPVTVVPAAKKPSIWDNSAGHNVSPYVQEYK